jgi:hypothetical protein
VSAPVENRAFFNHLENLAQKKKKLVKFKTKKKKKKK